MSTTFLPANEAIGEGKGNFPGRVAWVHNPDATNEDCTSSENDRWYLDKNTDQSVVNEMLSEVLQKYTDKESDKNAWDAIFKNINALHDKGDVGYDAGEKIAIKVNMNAIWYGDNGSIVPPGVYLFLFEASNENQVIKQTKTLIFER